MVSFLPSTLPSTWFSETSSREAYGTTSNPTETYSSRSTNLIGQSAPIELDQSTVTTMVTNITAFTSTPSNMSTKVDAFTSSNYNTTYNATTSGNSFLIVWHIFCMKEGFLNWVTIICVSLIFFLCYTGPLEKPEFIEEILSEFPNIYLQNFSF